MATKHLEKANQRSKRNPEPHCKFLEIRICIEVYPVWYFSYTEKTKEKLTRELPMLINPS